MAALLAADATPTGLICRQAMGTAIVLPSPGIGATRFAFSTTNDYQPTPTWSTPGARTCPGENCSDVGFCSRTTQPHDNCRMTCFSGSEDVPMSPRNGCESSRTRNKFTATNTPRIATIE